MNGLPLKPLCCGAALAVMFAAASVNAEPVATEADQAVLDAAERHEEPLLETLETLVNIDSGTTYEPGLAEVEAILEERLRERGAEVETHPSEELGGNTLVGTLQGSGERDIMLMIHYDTVFGEGTASERPYRVEDGRAFGPGVGDAKGGVALILHSLAILEELEYDGYGTLTVVFNPDEERGSLGSRDLIQQLAAEQDAVLVFEPTLGEDGMDAVTTVTKGINYAFLEVTGRASHAGSAPEEGRNAVMELSHQL
ncbi:MAG: M20/M25/M40 family metallo-hydrolase, partial [Halomonas sp.]|nr:M20/M25/M40 family metallo-hydrolase [Halomonas sp.]